MKTFAEFQESVASLALKGGVKFLPKIPGAVKAVTSGVFTGLSVLQAKKKDKPIKKVMKGKVGENQKIKPELLDAVRKAQQKKRNEDDVKIMPKKGEAEKTQELINKYIGIKSKKPIVKPKLNKPENQFEDAIPTNNASSGNIAGLPPDNPPVKKKKRYIYGGRGSRKMWMA